MSDHTKIEWADATVNAVNGCTVLSPGCTNCYAMRSGGRNLPGHPSTGLTKPTKAGHVWTGEVRLNETQLLRPLRWKRPRRIFWNAHGDLFHQAVPDAWIDRVFAVCALTPHHQHLILTKRSARMREYFADPESVRRIALAVLELDLAGALAGRTQPPVFPLPNVWLGVSVEDQARADERIPDLLATPAAVRWLSCEPLLGPVDLHDSQCRETGSSKDCPACLGGLDWIVAGGESGPGARPMHPDWARSLRDQCASANVPFFFKQWGEWRGYDPSEDNFTERDCTGEYGEKYRFHEFGDGRDPCAENLCIRIGKKRTGRLLDGIEHNGFPA